MTAVTELEKALRHISTRHHLWRVFDDWVYFCAAAISNAVDLTQWQPREKQYLERMGHYDRAEAERFKAAFHLLKDVCHEGGMQDVMGDLFMRLELGNDARGQFFTPYELCRMMAGLTLDVDHLKQHCTGRSFIRLNEPACGAGAMIIAAADHMQAKGFNYQQHLHVTAVDIDERAALMAYVQFSLFYIPAVVVVGNTLSLEERAHWYTPAHIWDGWTFRLKFANERKTTDVQSAGRSEGHTNQVRGSQNSTGTGDGPQEWVQWALFDEPGIAGG